MASCRLLVFLLTILSVGLTVGLQAKRQEERKHGRGRLHQLCLNLLNGDPEASKDLHTAHDRIRHRRRKTKCRLHMKDEERCLKKYKPTNGTVHSFHDNFYGWVVNISCDRGYELKGRSFALCYEDLKKKEKPFCQIRDCGQPKSQKNASYIYNATTFGSRLRVSCARGFNLTGSSSSKCLASGKWMKISRCVKIECREPKSPDYGRYHDVTKVRNVRTILFECAPGYRLVGNTKSKCQYGVWKPDTTPTCVQTPEEKEASIGLIAASAAAGVCLVLAFQFVLCKMLRHRQENTGLNFDNKNHNNKNVRLITKFEERGILCSKDKNKFSNTEDNGQNKLKDDAESGFIGSCLDDERPPILVFKECPKENTASTTIQIEPLSHGTDTSDCNYGTNQKEEPVVPDYVDVKPKRDVCKESGDPSKKNPAPAVCLVTPLKTGDDGNDGIATHMEQQGRDLEVVPISVENTRTAATVSKLNWNKLFLYLVPRVCTDNWRFFAIHLLSTHPLPGQSVNTTISQIENRSKTQPGGEKIDVILYNILCYWKGVAKRACLADVETALNSSHHEDVVHDMRNDITNCYISGDEIDGCINKNNGLSAIPELEYRITPREQTLALFPCMEDRDGIKVAKSGSEGPGPVAPFTEELLTYDYQVAQSDGFRCHRDKRFYRTKRQYSYSPYQNLRYKYKFHPKNKIPSKLKSKVEVRKKRTKIPDGSVTMSFTNQDKLCVDLLFHILALDPNKHLNVMECRLFIKYIIDKILKNVPANTSMYDMFKITYDEYKMSEHVPTTRNGTLHIVNSGELRLILTDDIWTLVETYVHRVRNDILSRIPEASKQYLFMTYSGKQVTKEYFSEKDTDTTAPAEFDAKGLKFYNKDGEQSVKLETNVPEESDSKVVNVKSFDVKMKVPVSRNSNYVSCTQKELYDPESSVSQHKRRYFCEKQTATIEAVFRQEIKQGSVTENAILKKFHDCAELRDVFGIQPNEVTKILVKKVADRVRCFIRKRKHK